MRAPSAFLFRIIPLAAPASRSRVEWALTRYLLLEDCVCRMENGEPFGLVIVRIGDPRVETALGRAAGI